MKSSLAAGAGLVSLWVCGPGVEENSSEQRLSRLFLAWWTPNKRSAVWQVRWKNLKDEK